MKLKKQLASLAVMGMMSLVAVSSAFASGVGVVNFDTLVQSHKDFPKVSAQMQAAEGIPIEIVTVIQSLIVLFIAAPPLVRAILRLPQPGAPRKAARAARKEVAA